MDYISILSMHQELGLIAVFLLVFLADLFLPERSRPLIRPIATLLLVIQLVGNIIPDEVILFGGMYHSTPMASVMKSILTLGTILVFMQSNDWLKREDTQHKTGEFYILTLSTLIGMFFMVSAGHFLLFFLGLELASVPMACLIAFDKYKGHSAEAGAKFILSALFSSGLMLYGISMIYGTIGTLYFQDIPAGLNGNALQILALVFFFSGLAFKLSLVPFHLWTADAYQGAPTNVTAYLSVISKGAAAFATMVILVRVFGSMSGEWSQMLSSVIIATITIGNLFAIRQSQLKRFMAFSSISQAGYILLAVLAGTPQGMASLVYYMVVYIVANLAVFGVIASVEHHTHGKLERADYNGLYQTNPKLAMVMTLALFSLAGIPPFAGFFSKFFVFAAAFNSGYYLVVFIALVNTVISLYYYLLIIKAMFITPNEQPIPTFKSDNAMRACLMICVAGIILLGIVSNVYSVLSDTAVKF
ncbi:MAG: NADH-quinone oxidoreductase subunit N [Bacteroidaceae bacterium]|nr:NADH-quinone oxidoreductase subunit N [Bacteroidaceae bacterium]